MQWFIIDVLFDTVQPEELSSEVGNEPVAKIVIPEAGQNVCVLI